MNQRRPWWPGDKWPKGMEWKDETEVHGTIDNIRRNQGRPLVDITDKDGKRWTLVQNVWLGNCLIDALIERHLKVGYRVWVRYDRWVKSKRTGKQARAFSVRIWDETERLVFERMIAPQLVAVAA